MVLSNIMTVHAGPRTWSSYTNVNNHHPNHQASRLSGMNSVQELNNYHRSNKYTTKTAATTYDFPDNPSPANQNSARKDKKWSFGSLFRRKKRDDAESSSDGDSNKSFLTRRRKKKTPEKKNKRNLVSGNFDHIVPNPINQVNSWNYYTPQSNGQEDIGVLSDLSGGFSPSYLSRPLPRLPQASNQLDSLQTNSSYSVGSSESSKRPKRDRQRLRSTRINIESSSDDDSQSSTRLKSDESLVRSRDSSACRNSRSARTERYIRRLSKDEENILNREGALIAAARSGQNLTIPQPNNRYSNSQLSLEAANVSIRPQNNCFSNRSISYEANIHRSPINLPSKRIKNLSLGNPHIETARYPPTPPPRDPKRIPQDPRPISTYYNTTTSYQQNSSHLNRLVWNQNNRSNSEDHIAIAENNQVQQPVVPRPSSAQQQSHFQYLAEKKPRSRRPIVIQSNERINQLKNDEVKQIFTAQTHVHTNIFLPSCLNSDISSSPNCMMGVDTVDSSQAKEVYMPRQIKNVIKNDRSNSPFKPISSPNYAKDVLLTSSVDSLAEELASSGQQRRKSTNLEEALDELEAIYKSLHLGDEDLLERAEQREMSAATKKLIDSKAESYPGFAYSNKENIFTYEPFDSSINDASVNKRRLNRRSQTIDRKFDDMAYRKMTRERSSTIADPSSVISYLLTSPVHGSSPQELIQDQEPRPTKEPDITLDDVVFRNIKHANGNLKVQDPQPPFGIPIGPISTAPNSDYLHAIPDEEEPQYTFNRRRIPDIVKDDLAYRNLRKELNNKESIFKSLVPEDVENNNADLNIIKKKRAVRSLSANITNLLQKDAEYQQQVQEIDDVADAMEIARQILREKEEKINCTNRAFMSDTDARYRKDSISESRLNFLNTMKSKYTYRMEDKHKSTKKNLGDNFLESKPPKNTTPERRCVKESTPVPHSPSPMLTRQDSLHSSLEELLTAFAVEARETSDRITNELIKLDEDVTKKLSGKTKCAANIVIVAKEDDFSIEDSPKSHKRSISTNKVTFSEDVKDKPPVAMPRKSPIKEPSPRAAKRNISSEKTLLIDEIDKVAIVTARIVNTPTKELAVYRNEVDDNIPINDKIKTINETANHAKQCEELAEAIIECAKVEMIEESIPESVITLNQDTPNQEDDKSTSPEHDYVNLSENSDVDLRSDPRELCKSPFEEHKAELIASFQELGKMIDDACLKTDDAISISKEDVNETSPKVEGESELCAESNQYKTEEELDINDSGIVTGYTSSCTIFVPSYDSSNNDIGELASLESLKSPKLVYSTLSLSNLAIDSTELDNGSQFTSLESQIDLNNSTEVDKIPNNVADGMSVIQAFKEANVSSTCQNRPLQFIDNLDLDESELLVNEQFDKNINSSNNKFVDNLEVDDNIGVTHLKASPVGNKNSSQSSSSKSCTDERKPFRRDNFRHDESSSLKQRPWYCDPMLVLIVCYYGLACSYQLATMDAVTILGLVFVIVSVIAAMIL